MPGCEKSYKSEPFQPVFLERWRGFNTFRFMDWQRTNGSQQRDWAGRPRVADCNWTEKGIPVEVMVALANRLKINPWFCLPHEASDEYVQQFARLVKLRLDPTLKVYVEYSNEVWNSMFLQHKYAEAKAKELGLGPKERPWEGAAMFHSRRSVEIFRIWEQVFGGKERLVRVIAWQAAGGDYWSDKMVLSQEEQARTATPWPSRRTSRCASAPKRSLPPTKSLSGRWSSCWTTSKSRPCPSVSAGCRRRRKSPTSMV